MIESTSASVLVVEDNADNLFAIIDMLNTDVRARYVNARASGRQMFRLLDSKPGLRPDLILLDLQITCEDGYAVLRQLRKDPRTRASHVVAVAPKNHPDDLERCRAAGFDGFIAKPIDTDQFPNQIRRILAGEPVWERV
jgi:two-component system cell cycle response regulator DivK